MLMLFLLQDLVPLVLIGWLTFAPPSSAAGFWTQVLSTAVVLVELSFTGIWMFPPWWAPYVFGTLLFAGVVRGVASRRARSVWPQQSNGWLPLVGFAALGLYAAHEAPLAVAAQQIPVGRVVDLASPLGVGTYLVANGGSGPSINAHAALLDQAIVRHGPYRGTAHGVDLVAIDGWGLRADGLLPIKPSRYLIFGRAVVAPCGGDVVAAVDGLPDMQVPQVDRGHLAGNHVVMSCSGIHILLGHFKRGTIVVRVGEKLSLGDAIARVGNSGNTSEPHLHVHSQEPGTEDAPFSGTPIPIRINGQYLVRNDRLVVLGQTAGAGTTVPINTERKP